MRILIVDDDATQREMLQGFLVHQAYDTISACDGPSALEIFQKNPIDLALLDNRMPGMSGEELLEKIKTINPLTHVIMITAYGDIGTVINTMKLGAVEFFEKPVDLTQLLERIREIEQTICRDEDVGSIRAEIEERELPLNLIAESDTMKEVLSRVRRVAQNDWPVLVTGETGTGKEVISRLIHLMGERKQAPFIDINCAAIPDNLFESELFGHIKGAFTGATNSRRGCFEMAHEGTLFMDEIGEMPLPLQSKLLRAIQEKRIKKIGSEKDIAVNVRLISATNRDLKKMSQEGTFREDLYYRINVLEIEIPPLRERKIDIPILVTHFLKKYANERITFSSDAVDALIKYPFPGNVRELEHVVQRTVTFARATVIRQIDLPDEVRRFEASERGSTLDERLFSLEHEVITSALEKTDWVQTRAAEHLGISERVLRYKMKRLNINRPNFDS